MSRIDLEVRRGEIYGFLSSGWSCAGQEVYVRVDAYPSLVFTGMVLRLADEAESTPTNVQTREDR